MDFKKCTQCEAIRHISEYRKYYNSTGRYSRCKRCESTNNKFLYLIKKDEVDTKFIDVYTNLYHNKRPLPKGIVEYLSSNEYITLDAINDHLNELQDSLAPAEQEELQYWLTVDLNTLDVDEDELDEILLDLKAKYMPEVDFDNKTLTPIFCDTYESTISQIKARFNQHLTGPT